MLVVSIFGVPNTISLLLSVLDIPFFFGKAFIQVMFASRYDTNISFGHFLYGMFCKSHLVWSLTVRMILSTWCSGINYFCTVSNSLLPTTISMFIFRAVNVDMVVFRTLSGLVAPRHFVFIIELSLILNGVVKMNIFPFTNMKSTPSCSFLWWYSSSLVNGACGMFCTCCGIFWTILPFKMETLGPYIASALLMPSTVTLV